MSEQVKEMFSEISGKYDLLNDILSFGVHFLWRRKLLQLINIKDDSKILDCACGTGLMAIEMAKHAKAVTGTDFCPEMIDIAKRNSENKHLPLNFDVADAMNLPFEDNTFDITTIAYGIRNVDSAEKCLIEMARVSKPNGTVAVLEFGQPNGLIAPFYRFYSSKIMPQIGKVFASSQSAYTYLPETAAKFPCGQKFKDIITATGKYSSSEFYRLNSGIAYIYLGKVKE